MPATPHQRPRITETRQAAVAASDAAVPADSAGTRDPDRGRARQRVMGHGDFRLILLSLIAEAPRHGYELIQSISEMFHGQYTPSPGSIYPLLAQLEQSGHTRIDPASRGRKRYLITAEGQHLLEQQQDVVAAAMLRLRHSARHALKQALPEDIRRAMHALKHALLMHGTHWTPDDIAHCSAAIHHAAQLIAGKSRHA
ncbi:PadR family transcriptional regulator [Frateuria aurantia]